MPLNDKQRIFIAEYLKDKNATQAAIRAGYSEKTAYSQGQRLLKHAEVQQVLNRKIQQVIAKAEFNAEQVIRQLERMVMFDPRKLFHEDGRPKGITELDDDTAMAVNGLDVHEEYRGSGEDREFIGYVKKYKLADRNTAVANALRMFGKFADRVEHTGKDGGPIETVDLSPNDLARRIAFALQAGMRPKDKQ